MNTLRTILVILVLSPSVYSQTITTRTTDTQFSQVIQGVCEGEPVALIGTVNFFLRRSESADGMIRIDTRHSLKGEGTGLVTGIKYNLNGKTTDRTFFSSAGIESFSWKNQLSLIGPGPGNDMFITYIIKQVGDVIVVDDFKGVCK